MHGISLMHVEITSKESPGALAQVLALRYSR